MAWTLTGDFCLNMKRSSCEYWIFLTCGYWTFLTFVSLKQPVFSIPSSGSSSGSSVPGKNLKSGHGELNRNHHKPWAHRCELSRPRSPMIQSYLSLDSFPLNGMYTSVLWAQVSHWWSPVHDQLPLCSMVKGCSWEHCDCVQCLFCAEYELKYCTVTGGRSLGRERTF